MSPFRFLSAVVVVAALAVLGVVALPAAAHARPDQAVSFEAPRDLLDPARRDAALAELDSLGVRSLRLNLRWRDVAPAADSSTRPAFDATDPDAYSWGQYDALMAAAQQRGWPVLVTIASPVPKWATAARRDTVTRPSPTEFRRFTTALARHYGTQVSTWSIWNEPNLPEFLRPQISRGKAVAPSLYRELYLAGRAGLLDGGSAGDRILLGETSPKGSTGRLTPLAFLRSTLCLDSKYRKRASCKRLDTEGYAHHAYATRNGPFAIPANEDDVTIAVIGRLNRALDRAAKAGAVKAGLPIYLTEFGIQSVPDTFSGVPLLQQAEYRAISERMARGNSRVVSFSQYLLRDDDPSGENAYAGFETGLRFANGKAKPALAAFRLPLAVAKRAGGKVSVWGMARPASASVRIELQYADGGGSFRRLRTITTDGRGSFTVSAQDRAKRRWRLRWTAPDGKVYTGPATRAYGA